MLSKHIKKHSLRPICNSSCTKGKILSISLEKDIKESIKTGNLKKIDNLMVNFNDKNNHIRGFQNLSSAGTIDITSETVKKLGPFPSLINVANLMIQNCTNLEEFAEPLLVEDMSTFGHQILISGNPKLKNLKGLSNLKRVHHLQLIANRGPGAFSTLEGLENLEFAENLNITGNGNLTSLRALKKLKQVPNRLTISSNNNLPKCEIDWLLAQLETRPKQVIIMANGPDDVSCPP
jgi:hypothetical protein